MTTTRAIKGLGEIALQVADLDRMTSFYQDVVNLELLKQFPQAAFFRIADGVDGHTQVLALFDRAGTKGFRTFEPGNRTPPLDHLAFGISLDEYEGERQRLLDLGCEVSEDVHSWVGWRSIYVKDPEGNQVEWVCYDETTLEGDD